MCPYFHAPAVAQTVEWLDKHGIPYWDLCLMPDKAAVNAHVYVEDSPGAIKQLADAEADVIIFENSTNLDVPGERARDWTEAEGMIRKRLERQSRSTAPTREELLERPPEA
jgi:hypothetical protein